MRKSRINTLVYDFAFYYTDWYPKVISLAFLSALYVTKIPYKNAFAGREIVALVIAVFLAHVNRIFYLYPAHLLFPSGHTTLCLGLAVSLGWMRPWTLCYSLPGGVLMALSLVCCGYHDVLDVVGSFPLIAVVYGLVYYFWQLPSERLSSTE